MIYRYFGGLPKLITAFGREGNFRPETGWLRLEQAMDAMIRCLFAGIAHDPFEPEILKFSLTPAATGMPSAIVMD